MQKKCWTVLVMLLLAVAVGAAPCTIESGKSPGEVSAAALLEKYIARLTGNSMEVICNGKSPVKFVLQINKKAAPDSWQISTGENNVLLSGGNERGVIYAVAHFLEDHCGVFFYNPYEEFVPEGKILKLADIDRSGTPFFRYRHIYRGNTSKKDNGLFAVLNRLNNDNTDGIKKPYGGVVGFGPPRFVHTMWSYVPQEKFFASKPEYYSLVNGKRRAGRDSQLCMSNPELPEVIFARLENYVAQGKVKARRNNTPEPLFYDISINDNNNYCRCAECKKISDKHGQSGLLLHLLNPVAQKLKAKHPELFITTLAYNFTQAPPRGGIKAADNIIIRLCPKFNQAASILEKDNAMFCRNLKNWAKVCKTLFIWDYAETYIKGGSGMPFASELFYGDRYKFYAQNQVKGIMWEHPFEPNADWFELKFYLETRLLEDPFADVEKLTEKFVNSYYGKAAGPLLESRKLLDASRRRANAFIRFMSPPEEFQFSTAAELRAMQACYDRAEAAVKADKVLLSRVRRARRGLDRLCVFRALPPVKADMKVPEYDRDLALKAMQRLQESWLDWLQRYPNSKELIADASHEMSQYKMVLNGTGKAPGKFAGREYYDFQPARFQNHDLTAITLVPDPESEVGYAAKINVAANPKMYAPPFVMGFRNRVNKTNVNVKLTKFPQKKGYHWHRLGRFTVPKVADIFLSRSWGLKQHFSNFPEKRQLEFFVSIKFTGPSFRANDTAEDAIYIDRIIGLIPENK